MRPVRILLTADNHLGRFYDRMPPQRLEERRKWLRRGFRAAVDCALERRVDLFLQAGDLFDTPDPRNIEREFVAECLAQLARAGVRCYGVGGNHDTPKMRTEQGGVLPQGIYHRLGGLTVFPQKLAIDYEIVDIDGVRVAVGGLTRNPSLPPDVDPLEVIEPQPVEADIRLLLLHYSIEGHTSGLYLNDPCVRRRSLEKFPQPHIFLMGHIHRFDEFGIGPHRVLVPGATEKMTFDPNEKEPGFLYFEVSPGGVVEQLQHVPAPPQPRQEVRVRTTELDRQEPFASILRRLEPLRDGDTMLKLRLEGPIPRDGYQGLELRKLHEFALAHFFSFDLDMAGLDIEDELHRSAEKGVRLSQEEEIALVADEMYGQSEDEGERQLILAARDEILSHYSIQR